MKKLKVLGLGILISSFLTISSIADQIKIEQKVHIHLGILKTQQEI